MIDHDIPLSVETVSVDSVMLRFGEVMDPRLPAVIAACQTRLLSEFGALIDDAIPAYTALLLCFNAASKSMTQLSAAVFAVSQQVIKEIAEEDIQPAISTVVDIPTCYDKALAMDLERIAEHNRLDVDTVITRHSGRTYQVYAVGFIPGFAYLGELDNTITCPRLDSPRKRIPAGSIGIAEAQTGIYPVDSPAGWNIIGRTPQPLLFPERPPADICALRVGDKVRFKAISLEEFLTLGGHFDNHES